MFADPRPDVGVVGVVGVLSDVLLPRVRRYLAEELGVETTKKKFWFGFANEQGLVATTTKLRVIVASDVLLRQAFEMINQ